MAKATTAAPKKAAKAPAKAAPKTAAKAAPKAAPKATAAPAAKPISPVVVTSTVPTLSEPAMRKKELIDEAVLRSGIKKKSAKPVVEALLEILGETLSEGREMNIQPLGKLKVNRVKDVPNGKVIIAKVRQSDRSRQTQNDPLAKAAE